MLGTSDRCIATHPSDMDVALMALDAVVRLRGASGSLGMGELLIEGDVVVLLGTPAALAASETRLLTGK